MADRYQPEVYSPTAVVSEDRCCRAGCSESSAPQFRTTYITVRGRPRSLPFCARHGEVELEDERLYRMGL